MSLTLFGGVRRVKLANKHRGFSALGVARISGQTPVVSVTHSWNRLLQLHEYEHSQTAKSSSCIQGKVPAIERLRSPQDKQES
eukprot:215937-Amphidinium_carterae.1